MFLLYSRSFGIAGGVVAGGVTVDLDESAGGVVAGGIVWVADIANATLIRNTSWIEVFAIGFGASVVAGIAGAAGATGATGVVGAVVDGAVVDGAVVDGAVVDGAVVDGTVGVIGAVATSASFPRIDSQLTDKAFESGVVTWPSPHTISPPKWAVIPMPAATRSDANLEIFNRPGQESLRTSEVMNASAINPAELPIPNQRCRNNSLLALPLLSAKNQPLADTNTLANAAIQVL